MNAEQRRRILLILAVSAVILVVLALVIVNLSAVLSAVQSGVDSEAIEDLMDALPIPHLEFDPAGHAVLSDGLSPARPVTMMGTLERGQVVEGRIGMNRIEGWQIDGSADDHYVLDFDALEGGFNWQMTVYLPDLGIWQVAYDSDVGFDDPSILDLTLPENGTYYIILDAFGQEGAYALRVE